MITTQQLADEQEANMATYSHMAFFTTAGAALAGAAIGTLAEIGRVALTKSRTANKITLNWALATTDCNCLNTTVIADAGNSTTQFKLNSVIGLGTSGDLIQISMPTGAVTRAITGRTGSIVTIDLPLTGIPPITTVVKLMINQRGLIKNGTGSAGSGTIVDIQQYTLFKDSTMGTGTAKPIVGNMTDTLE